MKYPDDFINRIICGDCLEVMPSIPDKSIDMILCDLPYGTTACKWDVIIPFESLWKEYKRIIKDNGAIVLFGNQPFTSMLVMSNIEMFKYCWIWNKGVGVNFFYVKKQPLKIIEDICIFYRKQPTYNPIMIKREKPIRKSNNNAGESFGYKIDKLSSKYIGRIYEEAYPSVILHFSSQSVGSRGFHPTQKPVALFEYLIKTYTNKCDLILDNCAGSGTTGVACKNLGRDYILIEKEKKYVEIAKRRIKAIPELLF